MKATLSQKALADALSWVSRAISKNPPTPEMAGIRMVATENAILLAAFDFEVSHRATVEAEVGEDGDLLISGRFLTDIVNALKPGEVALSYDGEHLTIKSGRSSYRTRPLPAENYPTLPVLPDLPVEVNAEAFAALVASTKSPADDNSPFEGMRGLRIEGGDGAITLVGLQRSMIAVNGMDYDGPDFAVTLPVRALEDALRGLSGDARVGTTDSMFGISDGSRSVTSRVFASKFVEWQQVLSVNAADAYAWVGTAADLLSAVKRTRLLADRKEPRLLVSFNDGELGLSALAESGDGEEAVEGDTTGDGGFQISVNPYYFAEGLAAVPSGLVEIRAQERKPLWIKPLDHPHMTSLLMAYKSLGGTP